MKKSLKNSTPRRFTLNRETLRALDEQALPPVLGGETNPDTACIRCRWDLNSAETCLDCPAW
jgi:hypothetical protein